MPSSTSSSEARFLGALALTFAVLFAGWESVLRAHAGATANVVIDRPAIAAERAGGDEWLVFGNCLMMTGVSPAQLGRELPASTDRSITNIAAHEQSPIAFFEYLRAEDHYPSVVVLNVSSWLNGTAFEQEGVLVTDADPLGLATRVANVAPEPVKAKGEQAYRQAAVATTGSFQARTEEGLASLVREHVVALGHRYHLFDWSMFAGSLVAHRNLDEALYQLNMQAWFRVTGQETDGRGYVGMRVAYRSDWDAGLEQMVSRSLQRLRLSRTLTPRYWELLQSQIAHFESKGTRVFVVRMPEHPQIRRFNDETYDLPGHLRSLHDRLGVSVLDLSALGTSDGVRLFDGVHPDADAASVITRAVAAWLRPAIDASVGSGSGVAP